MSLTTVPTYEQLMSPLLSVAADGQPHRIREVAKQVADSLSLPENLREEALPDGRNKLIHRLEWARTYLKKAGLLEYPNRGMFKITERGIAALSKGADGINNRFLQQFQEFREFKGKKSDRHDPIALDTHDLDPEEAIENAYQSVRAAVEDDLLSRLKAAPPDFFERLVVDLLLKMGYGGSRKEAGRAIGKSGDEGIDGVIDEDLLGLDVVYVQAKRWSDQSVSRQHIQQFVGALQGKRARKGVFITTSTFTQSARDDVNTIENRVVLIDGDTLAGLLFDYGIGVSDVKSYRLKRVDSDYFDE
ncbi:MAG: restriction endonuclease [Terriglobales bacterium]